MVVVELASCCGIVWAVSSTLYINVLGTSLTQVMSSVEVAYLINNISFCSPKIILVISNDQHNDKKFVKENYKDKNIYL